MGFLSWKLSSSLPFSLPSISLLASVKATPSVPFLYTLNKAICDSQCLVIPKANALGPRGAGTAVVQSSERITSCK